MTTELISQEHAETGRLARALANWLAGDGNLAEVRGLTCSHAEALLALAHHQFNSGSYADACTVFAFLAMHWHEDRRFVLGYAAALQMTGGYEKAVDFYARAAALEPGDPTPEFRRSECLLALSRRKEALVVLDGLMTRCRDDAHAPVRDRAEALITLINQQNPA